MSHSPRLPGIEGLTWLGQDGTEDKLHLFRRGGASLLRRIIDWDGTIAPPKYSTWKVGRDALPLEIRKEHDELYREHKPIEDAGKLTPELMIVWSAMALQLQVKAHTPRARLQQEADQVQLRPHAKELFADESIIMSTGLQCVIEMVANRYGLRPANIFGIELNFQDDKVAGWDVNNLVDSVLKRDTDRSELESIRENRPHALIIGDQLHDANMADGNAIRLRIINEPLGTPRWHEEIERSKNPENGGVGFDGVMSDLGPAVGVDQWITGRQGLLLSGR